MLIQSLAMGCRRSCRVLDLGDQKKAMIRSFIYLNSFQAVIVIILCFISVGYFSRINISNFLTVDLITLLMSVVILSFIVIIVGWASAVSNATFAWFFFHLFMIALLLIEVIICFFASELSMFVPSASDLWASSDEQDKQDLQRELYCCGLANKTDMAADGCGDATEGCLGKLEEIMTMLRNTTTVAMFVCFALGLFIDFAGCALCLHPDVVTLADHEREMADIAAHQVELEGLSNPFGSE